MAGFKYSINENGEVWFCESDVAKALGYSNTRDAIIRHCRGVVKRDTHTDSGMQEMSFIIHPNLPHEKIAYYNADA